MPAKLSVKKAAPLPGRRDRLDNLRFLDLEPPPASFAQDMIDWLSGKTATPSAMYLYDEKGAALFEKICATPEYYLTRTETPLLRAIGPDIAALLGPGAQIVEFGSGSNDKARILLNALERPAGYDPIDISRAHLLDNAQALASEFPNVEILAICADFLQLAQQPEILDRAGSGQGRRLGFFPGSTLGNMSGEYCGTFLDGAAKILGKNNYFLVGIDLAKDRRVLEAAYDDDAGVSAAFSLNLIDRMKAELNAEIDKSNFRYEAVFNRETSDIEMRWVSLADQSIVIQGHHIAIAKGQVLLVELSHKFTRSDFDRLTRRHGFITERFWTDPKNWFALALLRISD